MSRIEFTNRPFYLGLTTTLFLLVFYHAILAGINGNPLEYLSSVVALLLIFSIALRHENTRMLLYLWAALFMVLSNSLKIVFKYLTQRGNQDDGFQTESIQLQLIFVVIGLLSIFGAKRFIMDEK
jgi:hypothetical protein